MKETPLWALCTCNDDVLSGKTDPNRIIKYIDISNVTAEKGITGYSALRFGDAPSRARRLVQKGDIIVSTVRTYLQALALIDKKHEDCVFSTGFAVLRPKRAEDSLKIFLALKSSKIINKIICASTGVAYPAITPTNLLRIKIALPENPLSLLEHIRLVDQIINKKEVIINKLAKYRQTLITIAITKGLDSNIKMKDSELPWLGYIPDHWSCMRLAHCFSSVNRPANLDLPVLSVSIHTGISDTELNDEDRDRKVWLSEDRSKYQCINNGDLVYNMMRAWQGALGTCTRTGLVSPAYTVLVPKKGILSKYYELLFRTPNAKHLIYGYSQGIADFRKRLYWQKARDIYVPVPPFEEQIRIADKCDFIDKRIDDLKKEISKQIDLLNEYKSALLASAFMEGN